MKRPTEIIREGVDELLARNERTAGARVKDMFLGSEILVVRLAHPVVIEGQWENVERTADLFDLMDAHRAESGHG